MISLARTFSTLFDQPDTNDGQEESLTPNTMSISNANFPYGLLNVVLQVTGG